MKRLKYETPVTEITKWEIQDIITTSGGLNTNTADIVSVVGDKNYTANAEYTEIN